MLFLKDVMSPLCSINLCVNTFLISLRFVLILDLALIEVVMEVGLSKLLVGLAVGLYLVIVF